MSDRVQNILITLILVTGALVAVSIMSSCAQKMSASSERENLFRAEHGYEYVPSGTWIKRNPSIEKP